MYEPSFMHKLTSTHVIRANLSSTLPHYVIWVQGNQVQEAKLWWVFTFLNLGIPSYSFIAAVYKLCNSRTGPDCGRHMFTQIHPFYDHLANWIRYASNCAGAQIWLSISFKNRVHTQKLYNYMVCVYIYIYYQNP